MSIRNSGPDPPHVHVYDGYSEDGYACQLDQTSTKIEIKRTTAALIAKKNQTAFSFSGTMISSVFGFTCQAKG
ncbi:MAG: hypothetical protein RPT00_04565 [Gammaproteobacteria bacterium]|jgi:hypothetical protein